MSEKVVLPKFDLPGDRMHPAMKVLLSVAGLLVFAMVLLGGALWRHRSMELAEEARKQAVIAARTAEANAVAEAAKARQAEAQASAAAAQAKIAEVNAAKHAPKAVATAEKPASSSGKRHSLRHSSSKGGSKATVAAAPAKPGDEKKPTAASKKKGDDVIDKLLASYK
jgi:hypothetical protein